MQHQPIFTLYFCAFSFLFLCKGYLSCLQQERTGLLQVKASVAMKDSLLLTWVDADDCCSWERITCNPTTGRVTALYLNQTYGYTEGEGSYVNASLFLPFQQLRLLDLSDNRISGWKINQGFERLSQLKDLRVLNLRSNQFNNSILSSLGQLSSLERLQLGGNQLQGSLSEYFQEPMFMPFVCFDMKRHAVGPEEILLCVLNVHALCLLRHEEACRCSGSGPEEILLCNRRGRNGSHDYLVPDVLDENFGPSSTLFRNMSSLELLDLSLNQLDGFLPFHDLRNMSKLKILDLSSNRMSGRIPQSILSLNSLEALSIALNDFQESISGICGMKNLQELDLSRNKFKGQLPACLSNLTSLKELDVSGNQFHGKLSPSLISSLTSLEYISISNNLFEGASVFTSLLGHTSQFKFLGLSNCNLDMSTDELLKVLHNQYNLRGIDLSHNNLRGNFPNWLIENSTNLEFLVLRNNSLGGHIHFPPHKLVSLQWVDVSVNHLEGQLQTDMGHTLPKLICLNFSRNRLDGKIPTSIGNMTDLAYLDLIHNTFWGEIPESLGLGCRRLKVLLLCNNRLHGHIPPNIFNLTSLDTLHIRNNNLIGYIPDNNIASLPVRIFDISGNQFSGKVPTWIGNLTTLTTFSVHNNLFYGPVPVELCNIIYLEYLDLSENQISGPIPSCLMNLPSLKYLHLQRNKLIGSIPGAFLKKSKLLTLDLTHNNLAGSIPESLALLTSLRVVLLKENQFSGIIPHELCRLSNISILDVSLNMLSGSIPRCFGNITFGKLGVGDPLAFEHSEIDSVESLNYEYLYASFFGSKNLATLGYTIYSDDEEVDFMTKSRINTYKGDILNFMAGLDLSCNQLMGDIPLEIGALTGIHALNLSHNQFSGLIPKTLSNLINLESMDLSHNGLSGEIPSSLTSIYTLSVFTVAYNNLSGRIPDMKAQFSTFSETSYEGNPLLCGTPLQKQCTTFTDSVKKTFNEWSEKHGIDQTSLFTSFAVSNSLCFVGYVIIYLRHTWQYVS